MRPREYISFSQLTTFEMSAEKFAAQYLYGERQRISRNMKFGSEMAEGLEKDEATGNPVLDLMMARLPKFDRMDLPVEDPLGVPITFNRDSREFKAKVPFLNDDDGPIPLLALPDTAKSDYSAFKEYKTSTRPWSQKMADDSGQITFYATTIWLAKGIKPQELDIELVNVPVKYDDEGRLEPTGELVRLPTKRTMVDVLKMTNRIRRAWSEIQILCDKELL